MEDFFAPPFVVVGTTHERTRRGLTELFAFLGQDVQEVSVGTAEALKYACNAFHATKVSFANEMARAFRFYGVDSRDVMRVFSEDHKLNISPTYSGRRSGFRRSRAPCRGLQRPRRASEPGGYLLGERGRRSTHGGGRQGGGVSRFLFSSSYSLYGAAGDAPVTLAYCDGDTTLLSIADTADLAFAQVRAAADDLEGAGLLARVR